MMIVGESGHYAALDKDRPTVCRNIISRKAHLRMAAIRFQRQLAAYLRIRVPPLHSRMQTFFNQLCVTRRVLTASSYAQYSTAPL